MYGNSLITTKEPDIKYPLEHTHNFHSFHVEPIYCSCMTLHVYKQHIFTFTISTNNTSSPLPSVQITRLHLYHQYKQHVFTFTISTNNTSSPLPSVWLL